VLHVFTGGPGTPRLPERGLDGRLVQIAAAAIVHVVGAMAMLLAIGRTGLDPSHGRTNDSDVCRVEVTHVVFLAETRPPGAGGGGGGNGSDAPIRRAQGVGRDAMTLRTSPRAEPRSVAHVPAAVIVEGILPLPSIVLDTTPLASGTLEQVGLPSSGVTTGTSTGAGSGGGVGTGAGSGIGPGQGPGLGLGSGGGTGGGVFRPGGAVTPPRLVTEVRPKYTPGALVRHVQGTVELELVVTRDGRPSQVRIARSLDPGGLDDEAVAAVMQWRFEPGRAAGAPVDVLVVVLLDFWIR